MSTVKPQELLRLLDAIAKERNLDKELLFQDLEQAMVSAARKHFDAEDAEEFQCEVDRFTGRITLWRGEEVVPLEELGRIPAQTAKQVMIQRFREEERTAVFGEFGGRVGEVVTGSALRYEGGTLIVGVTRGGTSVAEAIMPRREQIPGEQHQPGDRVKCLILEVRDEGSAVKVIVSRAAPEFIKKLFEIEVPEISDKVVEIKAIAREPGQRTKVAVASIDSKVDAVGACVGVRGSRIRNVVDEMGGEKIDIVRWNESSQILIQNALSPAKTAEISLCFELGRATVVVPDDQLSLAIGKRGQNVRLAARLSGWDVDILTPDEYTKSLDAMEAALLAGGLSDEQVDQLAALGIISVMDMDEIGAFFLKETLGIDDATAQNLLDICAAKAIEVEADREKSKTESLQRKAAQAAEAAKGLDDLLGGKAVSAASAEADAGSVGAPASETPVEAAPEAAPAE